MKHATKLGNTRYRLSLALAIAVWMPSSSRVATARHVSNARPGGSADASARANQKAPSATPASGTTEDPPVGVAELPPGTYLGPGSQYSFIVDNHSINCSDPSVPGPGAVEEGGAVLHRLRLAGVCAPTRAGNAHLLLSPVRH